MAASLELSVISYCLEERTYLANLFLQGMFQPFKEHCCCIILFQQRVCLHKQIAVLRSMKRIAPGSMKTVPKKLKSYPQRNRIGFFCMICMVRLCEEHIFCAVQPFGTKAAIPLSDTPRLESYIAKSKSTLACVETLFCDGFCFSCVFRDIVACTF